MVGYVDGPEAGAGADVEDAARGCEGGEVETVMEGQEPEVVAGWMLGYLGEGKGKVGTDTIAS